MKNKVLLIRPANVYNYNNYPPLNLILLASALRKEGFEPEIVNSAFEPDLPERIGDRLKDTLLVAISLLTPELPDGLRIIWAIRKYSDVPIVVGGWHCTLFPEQMAAGNTVDYVITGEGEEHIVHIARLLAVGKRPDQKIFRQKTIDLDTLPQPDYSLESSIERFITNYLTDTLSRHVRQPMRWLPYESSRGCPSECSFCINVVTGNTRYRKKNAKKVIEEIARMVNQYNLTHIKFIDDNFFVDIRRVREICQGFIDLGLDITWDAECRCDYFNDRILNDETLALVKDAGLVQLTLGIESGSQRTLDLMKKHITPAQAEHAVAKCDQFGIIARSSFMLEVPGETREDILETIRFVNRMRKYRYFSCGIGSFRPYPKCELTENLIQQGFLKEPVSTEEWITGDVISMYTAAEYIRPWQVDGRYSVSAAYFLNMESGTRLGSHQIHRFADRLQNSIYVALSMLRNRLLFYRFPYDMHLYKRFLEKFYQLKGNEEKGGSYPLAGPGKNTR